jgi:hypothetical protein
VRRRSSVIFNSLEENYGAVVGANHRALAQLLEALGATPLPNETTSVSVPCYAGECRHPDEKSLVLLQILAQLEQMQQAGSMSATLDQFRVVRPKVCTNPKFRGPHKSQKKIKSTIDCIFT